MHPAPFSSDRSWLDPPAHPCELPSPRGIQKFYRCPDCLSCYTVNPLVHLWFRYLPSRTS